MRIVYNEYTTLLLNPRARSADWTACWGAPLFGSMGSLDEEWLMRGAGALSFAFDLKSALQSTVIQRRHALMADNMLYLYSSWV